MELFSAIRHRRSYYHLTNSSLLETEEIASLIQSALKYTPSAFNMQSACVGLVLGDKHHALWEELKTLLKPLTAPENFEKTYIKIDGFKAAFGTILFFNDDAITHTYAKQYPLYANNFNIWSEQANGMLQNNVWMLLEEKGLGANLQHYNPIIDPFVHTSLQIPENWRLIAQMPFGLPEGAPTEKTYLPLEGRFKQIGG